MNIAPGSAPVLAVLCLTVVLSATSAAAELEEVRDATRVRQFWDTCAARERVPADVPYRTRTWGEDEERSERLLVLIQSGEKTVTFTTPWWYEGYADRTPIVDGFTVVTDLRGRPRFVLRTTRVYTKPFKLITEEETRFEGPGTRALDAWRRVHWSFFTRRLAPLGLAPTEDMPVTVEFFTVVCVADRPPSAAPAA